MRSPSRKQFIALFGLLLVGAMVWLYTATSDHDEGRARTARSGDTEPADSSGASGGPPDRLSSREVSPASDRDWLAPGVDPLVMETLLEDPPSQLDVFVDVEWLPTNAWASIPDVGGPWSLARRECATEKFGFVVQEPCDYFVNVVLRRGASGSGEVVAARVEFDTNSLEGYEDARLGGDPSLASARCRNFARCLVTRGYAKAEDVPLPPGAEGDLVAFQIAGRELPRPDSAAERKRRLDAAIEGTLKQLRMFEDNPKPDDLAWTFNVALLRRALEYYEWLETQI